MGLEWGRTSFGPKTLPTQGLYYINP